MNRIIKPFTSIILLLAIILCHGISFSETEDSITILDIMEANTIEAVLRRHDNAALYINTDDSATLVYADNEIRYEHYIQSGSADKDTPGDYEYLLTSEHSMMVYYIRYQNAIEKTAYYMMNIGLGYDHVYTPDNTLTATLAYDPETTALEKVVSISMEDDNLIVKTELDSDTLNKLEAGYPTGSTYEVIYTLDKNTLEILGTDERLLQNGKTIRHSTQRLLYDIQKTEDIVFIQEILETFLTDEDSRTVTYIVDPGKESERTYSITGAKYFGISFWTDDDGYDYYSDADGTNEATDDFESDLTFYVIKH